MLDIQLLGDFVLLSEGSPVSGFTSTRLRSLLAYLLLHRHTPRSRSALAFSLWPDSSEDQAHASLRSLLHLLRHVLPDAGRFLQIDSRVVQWRPNSPFKLDVAEFEAALARGEEDRPVDGGEQNLTISALKEAVDLYRGDLLPTCYDDWILPERERLRWGLIRTLERLVALLESQSDYQGAVDYAQRLLQHDPLHESTYRLLMRLYASMGDPARALRVYHTCATVLQRELNVEPGPSTRQAYESLIQSYRQEDEGRRTKDDLRPITRDQETTDERLVATELPVSGLGGRSSGLVGRQSEWAQLYAAWLDAVGGKPQLVVIEGEAGIGKTVLAERLADTAARQGYKMAVARCYEAEGNLAYAPIVSWLRARPLPHLEPVWHIEVARLLPEALAEEPSQHASPGRLSEPWQRQRLFEALARAILGSGVSLLVLDDLQWCDVDTLEFLHFLLRFDPHAPLLVVAALRPEQVADNQPLSQLFTDLYRKGKVSKIALSPLNEAETLSLATQMAPAPDRHLLNDLSERLYKETEGNPLFVVEMVRSGILGKWEGATPDSASHIPNSVRTMIESRLSQLSAEALATARLAATIGRAFVFPVLMQAGTLSEPDLVKAVDELWQRRIVREYGTDAYDFSHDKVREVAYLGLSPARRGYLHKRVAEALESVYKSDLDSVSGEIGSHYEKAGNFERAIRFYERAGDAARAIYANDAAVGYYQRLLPHLAAPDRIKVLLKLGTIQQLVGRWPAARASYLQAASDAETIGEMDKLAEAEAALGALCRQEADYPQAIEWLEKAYARFGQLGDQHGMGEALGRLGEVYWSQSDYTKAPDLFRRCLEIARSEGDRQGIARAMGRLGSVYADHEDYSQALDWFEQQLKLATELDDRPEMVVALWNMGNVRWLRADYMLSITSFTQALRIANEIGYRRLANMSISGMGGVYYDSGEYDHALACYTNYLNGSLSLGNRIGIAIALGNLAATYISLGRYDEAEIYCGKAIRMARALSAPFYLHTFVCDAAELYESQGRPTDALPFIEEATGIVPGLQSPKLECKTALAAITIRLAAGSIDRRAALEELEKMLPIYTSDERQADVHYTIWKVDQDRQDSRDVAANLCSALYSVTAAARYKERYAELTGESLPDAPALPALPPSIGSESLDIASLLARVDELSADS